MFEPIHGSAPKHAGKNTANPLAAICAGQMMLEHLGETRGAALIEQAVIEVLRGGKIPSLEAGKHPGTREIGDLVASAVASLPLPEE